MRRILLLLLGIMLVHPVFSQHKALLIGVSEYPAESGWSRIHSDNDLQLVSQTLGESWDIMQLKDDKATRKGIEDSFNSLSSNSLRGDTILILFSGHGQQMVTDDVFETDGLDETIVPYDAHAHKSALYNGENHLRDHVFSEMIDKVRSKAGDKGLVLVLLDACHSDSMDKGDVEETGFRGTSEIFGLDDDLSAEELSEIRTRMMKKDTPHLHKGGMSNVAYISACQSYQKNWEYLAEDGDTYGRLSWSFSKAYREYGLSDISTLLNGIRSEMADISSWSGQRPEIRASFEIAEQHQTKQLVEESVDRIHDNNLLPVFMAIFGSIFCAISLLVSRRKRK